MQHCSTCSAGLIAGALFCDACGASQAQVKVARKLRQTNFDSIKDAKEGLLSPGERLKGRHHYVIEEAIARAPKPFARTGRGPVIIQSLKT